MTIESIEPTKDTPISGEEERERAALIDLLVPAAMLTVAVGAGVGSYLHLGLSAEFSAAIALTLFCLMLVGHVLLRVAESEEAIGDADQRMVASPIPSSPAPAKSRRGQARKPTVRSPAPEPAKDAAVARPTAEASDKGEQTAPVAAPPASPDTSAISSELAASIEAARDAEAAAMRSLVDKGIVEPPAKATAPARETPATAAEGERTAVPPPGTGTQPAAKLHAGPVPAAPAALELGLAPQLPPLVSARDALEGHAVEQATRDAWGYRPLDQRIAHGLAPMSEQQQALGAIRPSAHASLRNSSERTEAAIAEARRIDNILHRLAAQIRSGQAANAAAELTAAEQVGEAPILPPNAAPFGTGDTPKAPAASTANAASVPDADAQLAQETALSNAVDALRATVETMRQPTSGGAAVSVPASLQTTPAGDAAMLRLAAVAEALAAERAQVFLEPILKLSDEEARHFEVSVHLASPTGELLDARAMAEGAHGAGLLPLLDALGIRHSAGFALKLERRGRDGAVFSEVAGESLESEGFVTDVAGRHAQGIADRLVLTFAQSEVRGLGPAQLAALSRLRQLGFRFAIQNVADLDMDFEALAAVGFGFVKLDAAVFLDGLALAGTHIPASDLTRHFVTLGLDVIVGRIDAETVRARVLACGAEFGQGPLFGAPRMIPTGQSETAGVAA